MPTETLVQVCHRLEAQGYTGQCRAEEEGLRFLGDDDAVYEPEQVRVDHVIRLEGNSVPTEQTVVFAVTSPDGAKQATYCVTHGPDMDPLDADMLQRLEVDADHGQKASPDAPPLRQQF